MFENSKIFDVSSATGCVHSYMDCQEKLYKTLSINMVSGKNKLGYKLALPIALCMDSLGSIAASIGSIFETAIKGIINIVGSPFSKKCSLKRGVVQLSFNLINNTILAICKVFSVCLTILPMLCTSIAMPQETANLGLDSVRINRRFVNGLDQESPFSYYKAASRAV